jgi:molybdate/tungstate transport system substrate-binding protein
MPSRRVRQAARAALAATVAALGALAAATPRRCDAQESAPSARPADSLVGPLVVSSAGSLAGTVKDLLAQLVRAHPGLVPKQTSAGSVEAARQVMDSATVPDVLAVADVGIIPRLLVPQHASWYAGFARNAMVLAYTDRSAHAREITPQNWADVLLRPGVKAGHSDPALDPGGYRARIVFQLAERHYHRPGLAARLDAAAPTVTPAPGDNLVAMLERGALDYLLVYRTTVRERGLRSIELPPALNLSDPSLAQEYAKARVHVAEPGAADTLEVRGEPILYGVTIPTRTRHSAAGTSFVRLLLSPEGRAVLQRHGFVVPPHPTVGGPGSPPAGIAK